MSIHPSSRRLNSRTFSLILSAHCVYILNSSSQQIYFKIIYNNHRIIINHFSNLFNLFFVRQLAHFTFEHTTDKKKSQLNNRTWKKNIILSKRYELRSAQKFIYAFICGKTNVSNELWVWRCVCKLCCACSIRSSNIGVKSSPVHFFLVYCFCVHQKVSVIALPLSLVNRWRMNTTQFSLFLLSCFVWG